MMIELTTILFDNKQMSQVRKSAEQAEECESLVDLRDELSDSPPANLNRQDSKNNQSAFHSPLKENVNCNWTDFDFLRNGSYYTISRSSLQRFPSLYQIDTSSAKKQEEIKVFVKKQISLKEIKETHAFNSDIKPTHTFSSQIETNHHQNLSFKKLASLRSISSSDLVPSKTNHYSRKFYKINHKMLKKEGKWMSTINGEVLLKIKEQKHLLKRVKISLIIDETTEILTGMLLKAKSKEMKIKAIFEGGFESYELWNEKAEEWQKANIYLKIFTDKNV